MAINVPLWLFAFSIRWAKTDFKLYFHTLQNHAKIVKPSGEIKYSVNITFAWCPGKNKIKTPPILFLLFNFYRRKFVAHFHHTLLKPDPFSSAEKNIFENHGYKTSWPYTDFWFVLMKPFSPATLLKNEWKMPKDVVFNFFKILHNQEIFFC